jgi:glutamate 5-kinase
MSHYKRIVVKVGSNVLTRSDGTLNITRISALVDQIKELHKKNISVILVSSGAVASGRSEMKPNKTLDDVSSRQLFAAVGQAKLINRYYEFFREHDIRCGQVLTTKENFVRRRNYQNQKRCMEAMLENGVIPIVNENDTVSITELMFTDNDELAGLIAVMMEVDMLILLSNIDGIYDGDPALNTSKVIREIKKDTPSLSTYIQESKSQFGRGGMVTKSKIAQQVADEGIAVVIANGLKENILIDIIEEGRNVVCTRFVPAVV